jgi:hypothetical protein
MSTPARLCHHRTAPHPGHECLEACWSQGRSCRTCWVTCYRQGWRKTQVDADNARLVQLTRAQRAQKEAPHGQTQ